MRNMFGMLDSKPRIYCPTAYLTDSICREPGVLAAFEKLWGTDELIVSFDTINLTLPNASKMGGSKPWPHVDQAPERQGLSCVQGIINREYLAPTRSG